MSCLFEQLVSCLNPFSQFIIREINDKTTSQKSWQLDESIFGLPKGEVKQEFLAKTSSEMFAIYKYTNDPSMKVMSEKYTKGENVECKSLIPHEEQKLFESNALLVKPTLLIANIE